MKSTGTTGLNVGNMTGTGKSERISSAEPLARQRRTPGVVSGISDAQNQAGSRNSWVADQ
jgi:hypothetical protein